MADKNAKLVQPLWEKHNLASYLSCGKEQIDWLQCFGFQLFDVWVIDSLNGSFENLFTPVGILEKLACYPLTIYTI